MPRTKKYNEKEVIEKAMNVFWLNGYESTSMQMLEKEMGINKFSIYASFGNKEGVFLESLKCYKQKLNKLINKLKSSDNGIPGIKQYFYNFVEFTKETAFGRGCMLTNTANEMGDDACEQIKELLRKFIREIRQVFVSILKAEKTMDVTTIEQRADFLIISMAGLSSATPLFDEKQLENYIENIFKIF